MAVPLGDSAERSVSWPTLSPGPAGSLYRMLGSIDDAEDAVQDAFVRAWNGRATFREAVSLQAWLYRIATNACLDAIERRRQNGAADQPLGVGPFPDDLFEEPSASPEARYDAHESISLAFLTALQLLPPRQRSVLILRDVLAWRAVEVAELLELSVPAVNSALHRARTTVAGQYRSAGRLDPTSPDATPGKLRSLLERYVRAWESADVAGLVALLRDDAVVSMPPGLTFVGAAAIGVFQAQTVFAGDIRIRLALIRANGYAVALVDADAAGIARLDVFAQAAQERIRDGARVDDEARPAGACRVVRAAGGDRRLGPISSSGQAMAQVRPSPHAMA